MPKRKRQQDQDGLYRRGDSPYWWASFTDASGARVRRSTGEFQGQEAQDFLAKGMRRWVLLGHTCAAWLVQAGVSLAQVRDVLGHGTITMTERYAHLPPENARSALAAIDGGESQSGHVGDGTVGEEIAQVLEKLAHPERF